VLWNAQRLLRASGALEGVLLIGNDITERKIAEQQRIKLETMLRQAQKMEALGTFAGGIAHDFNNILTGIMGYIDLARYRTLLDPSTEESLLSAITAAERAKKLVGQMLSVAHKSGEPFETVEIAPIIKEACELLRASIPSCIDLKIDLDKNCGTVHCNPTQIHQVLMNLGTNAYHAIGDRNGVIGISCSAVTIGEKAESLKCDLSTGAYVAIEVSDTGTGMSGAILSRIFDPYFTTKERGRGTGLGLPVAKSIVQAHGGRILVESVEGKGSIFRVYLPKRETARSAVYAAGAGDWEVGDNESVLLVEDDEITAPMLDLALTAMKYRVTLASNGMEALTLFSKNPTAYDLMITDLTMPKMGGLELSKKVHPLRPDLPVVLMSGRGETVSGQLLETLGVKLLLTKPFDIGTLSRTLKSIVKKGK
jgi:signal transduction histidine kinase/ActR/RegA family two-component response regulator